MSRKHIKIKIIKILYFLSRCVAWHPHHPLLLTGSVDHPLALSKIDSFMVSLLSRKKEKKKRKIEKRKKEERNKKERRKFC